MTRKTQRSAVLAALLTVGWFHASAAGAQTHPSINVGSVTGSLGQTVGVDVTLSLNNSGAVVAGTQNDIAFDASTPIGVQTAGHCAVSESTVCTSPADCPVYPPPFDREACDNTGHCSVSKGACTSSADCPQQREACIAPPPNLPDCTVNSALHEACNTGHCSVTTTLSCSSDADCPAKQGFFTFLPSHEACDNTGHCSVTTGQACSDPGVNDAPDCPPHACSGSGCTGIRAFVFSVNSLTPLADNVNLFRCNVPIASNAPLGDHVLTISNVVTGDVNGKADSCNTQAGHCTVSTTQSCTSNSDCPLWATGTNGDVKVATACAADCDHSGRTTGTEITKALKIAGNNDLLPTCYPADSDHNGRVTGTDITRARKAAALATSCVPF